MTRWLYDTLSKDLECPGKGSDAEHKAEHVELQFVYPWIREYISDMRNELKILSKLNHPGLIQAKMSHNLWLELTVAHVNCLFVSKFNNLKSRIALPEVKGILTFRTRFLIDRDPSTARSEYFRDFRIFLVPIRFSPRFLNFWFWFVDPCLLHSTSIHLSLRWTK